MHEYNDAEVSNDYDLEDLSPMMRAIYEEVYEEIDRENAKRYGKD